MGVRTLIEWCDHTWNPWRGCEKISEGCENCYASALAPRNPAVLGEWGPDGVRAIAAEDYWKLPFRWERSAIAAGERRKVFVNSLSDIFEDNAQVVDARQRSVATIQSTPGLDYLLLTKRPENAARLASEALGWDVGTHGFPPNVWLGTSVETHEYLWRISLLMELKARIRFLSLEPLLANLAKVKKPIGNLSRFLHRDPRHACEVEVYPFLGVKAIPDCDWETGLIHWVIVGGESGGLNARPMDPDWVRGIRDLCQSDHVPFFFKQWGEWNPLGNTGGLDPDHFYPGRDPKLNHKFPFGGNTYRVGKKLAGRILDGREWSEFPASS